MVAKQTSTGVHAIVVVVTLVVLPVLALSTAHVVGDGRGWDIDVNYTSWAAGREFLVGHQLVFKYSKGDHNVYEVDQLGFQNCHAPEGAVGLATGEDIITLSSPGRKWYICGVPGHCDVCSQKLTITVYGWSLLPGSSPSHNTSGGGASPASGSDAARAFHVPFIIVVVVVMVMIRVF